MTSANTAETCAFPGCERPRRLTAGQGGGKPPVYCDLVNPSTGKYAHTSLTAAREQVRLTKAAGTTQAHPSPAAVVAPEAPASAARERAQSLLDQFRSEARQMGGTLQAAIEAMTSAADPDSVSVELTAARRQVERSKLETAEQLAAAEAARDQARTEAETAGTQAEEARTARDEAIAELETVEAAVAELRTELDQVRAEHATELNKLRDEHTGELRRVRDEAEQEVTAAQQRATEQVRTAQTEAADHVGAAEAARDQALTEASAARQAAEDATRRADDQREELRQVRADQREELATLRREHREELAAERKRGESAAENLRTEHQRQITTLQQALAALGAAAEQKETGSGGAERKQR